jgi:hypothetical protein
MNSPGAKQYLSTAEKERDKALISLREAEDDEWKNPSDSVARRRVQFWTSQVGELSAMPAYTIIPLH